MMDSADSTGGALAEAEGGGWLESRDAPSDSSAVVPTSTTEDAAVAVVVADDGGRWPALF